MSYNFTSKLLSLLLLAGCAWGQYDVLWEEPLGVPNGYNLNTHVKSFVESSALWGRFPNQTIPDSYTTFFVVYDDSGNVAYNWAGTYGGSRGRVLDVAPVENGFLVITSYTNWPLGTATGLDFIHLTIDAEELIEDTVYTILDSSHYSYGNTGVTTTNYEYIAHANPNTLAPIPLISAFSHEGDSLWTADLFPHMMDNGNQILSMRVYPDSGIVIAGTAGFPGEVISLKMHVTESGDQALFESYGLRANTRIVDALQDAQGELLTVAMEGVDFVNEQISILTAPEQILAFYTPDELPQPWIVTHVTAAADEGLLMAGEYEGNESGCFLVRWYDGLNFTLELNPFDATRITSITGHPGGGFLAVYVDDEQRSHLVRFEDGTEAAGDFPSAPAFFELSAYPNPFNPSTTIAFELPDASRISLDVFDVQGRLVRTLTKELFSAGRHTIEFDGSGLTSGIYFARLSAGSGSQTSKLVLLK